MEISTKTKNIPTLRFPGFLSEWKKERLGEACDFKQGVQVDLELQLKDVSDGYNKFLRIENYTQKSQDFRFIPDSISKNSKIDAEDIVVVRYGATAGFISRGLSGVLANNLFSIRPKDENKILKDFLYKILKQEKVFKYLQSAMSGGAMPALSFSIMRPIKINLPSYLEQQKIASFLGVVDEWIGNLRGQKESLEKYKKGMMQKLFPDKGEQAPEIRFKNNEGKDFPDWEEKKLEDVCEISTAPYIATNKNLKDGYYLIDMGSVSKDGKLLAKKRTDCNQNLLNKGDLIMPNRDIGHGDIIGKVALIDKNDKYVLGNNMYKLSVNKNNLSKFIFYLINSQGVNKEMRRRSNGTSQLQLIRKDVDSVNVLAPNIKEQQKIAKFLTSLDNLIKSRQQQITQAEQWKKGLMQGLFV